MGGNMGLGRWTAIVGGSWLLATIPIQLAINTALAADPLDGVVGQVIATVLWLAWIAWLIAAVVLGILWIVRTLTRRPATPATSTSTAGVQPAGWYPDPYGSGRLRWWDGSVWRDQYADPPTSGPPGV